MMFQTCSALTRGSAPPHRSASSRSRNGIQTLGVGVRPPPVHGLKSSMNNHFSFAHLPWHRINRVLALFFEPFSASVALLYWSLYSSIECGDWTNRNHTSSPWQAFESHLEVYLTKLGSAGPGRVANLLYCQTEFKYGKLVMLAAIECITPEFNKWPGYLPLCQRSRDQDLLTGDQKTSSIIEAAISKTLTFVSYHKHMSAHVLDLCFVGLSLCQLRHSKEFNACIR